MSRSLKNQLTFAINQNFSEGMDKHSIKAENKEMTEKIFSYSEKHRLCDVMKNFENYLKENGIRVKEVSQIKTEQIQKFLEDRASSCTQNTINSYANSFYKIQNVLNATYKSCHLKWREKVIVPNAITKASQSRGVESVIKKVDYNMLKAYAEEHYSQSGACVIMQEEFGVRVEEISRIKLANIDLEKQEVTFQCKGGKPLNRQFSDEMKDYIQKVIEQKHDANGERLFSIDGSSINKYLLRTEDKLGIERHSNHDIRRLIAQEYYDSIREQGYTPKEALSGTSKWLNHIGPRNELMLNSYIRIH